MDDLSARKDAPVLTEIPRYTPPPYAAAPEVLPGRGAWAVPRLNLGLFLLTFLTTTMAGADMEGAFVNLFHPLSALANLPAGLTFSVPLMLILLSHEMGHYVVAVRNGVDTTMPYFIPAPFPSLFFIGTFGAFIRMKSAPGSRRVMFDIGAAGPWAGAMLAVPAVAIGLRLSEVKPLESSTGGIELGNSLLFWALSRYVLGVNPDTVAVSLHPIAFAGWIGLFVTTLNLLPVGQLDGGHVIYALFGRRHRTISRLCVIAAALMVLVPMVLGMEYWPGWFFWAVLLIFLGLGHPAAADPETPLSPNRQLLAWLTIALFVATFSPVPFSYAPPRAQPPPGQGEIYNVVYQPAPPPALGSVRGEAQRF